MPSAFTYPDALEAPDSALLIVDTQLLPYVLGSVLQLQERSYWQSDQDWYKASEAISAFLECSMSACVSDLLESNNKLYRLLDSGLNGTVYTADGDPVIVSPMIGDVPTDTPILPGLIARVDHMEIMLDALPGTLGAGWFGIGGTKATLADVINALRVGTPEKAAGIMDQLGGILGAGANTAQIGELISTLFTSGVADIEEGGILVLLAAGIMGTLAGLGAISTQLTSMAIQSHRIISTLDGGNLFAPSDNVLQAIRGTEEATSTRNVIDAIVTALTGLETSDPDVLAKLEQIRTLLV